MKKILKKIIRLFLKIFWIIPINNNNIYFMCFEGNNFGFDPKACVDWLNENKKGKYKMFCGIKKTQEYVYENLTFLKLNSIKSIFYLMTSKIIIYNINPPSYIPYRKKQILINTWHGFPFKKCGKYTTNYSKEQFNLSTYFLSHSETYTNDLLKDSFEYEGRILNIGTPRNDVFFNVKKMNKNREKILEKFNINKNDRILLYAPTFRNNFLQGNFNINFSKLKLALENKFGGNWFFLIRLHPLISSKCNINIPNIIDVSKWDDMQELLCAADILITDYSSCIWDFGLTRKKAFIFADDLNEYQQNRGLYHSLYELPFPVAINNNELISNIENFENNKYVKLCDEYYKRIKTYDNGNSCENLFKIIEKEEV